MSKSKDELFPSLKFNFKEVGEFELVRQTLLGAHLSGGIDKCEELTKLQIRDFLDRIMIHENTSHLMLKIKDESVKNKVAFLMAEALSSVAGPDMIQKALDKNTGLSGLGISHIQRDSLMNWIDGVFTNALSTNSDKTISSLIPLEIKLQLKTEPDCIEEL